ncbi:hybrid sensor histidine kinase/response regulator [Leeuwenhoekiella parthenopeia]|uniref:histidine kinase n=1 Tax=Leeuwenhoekiella parthenopeia TaxID=2890320 RepID=A0ABS8GRB6_9FLAO|nr:ATP-binding protein [Leeuwenhoekiella parthenopeia]MCC4211696.1 response regulator [Leeuwenhoekiella parthenopeia]
MKNTKRSITLKVLTGYIMIGLLVFLAIWLIYPELKKVIYPPQQEQTANKKLTYISNALSYLYKAETIGRTAMATGSLDQFNTYTQVADSIDQAIDSLQLITARKNQKTQLDSIQLLLGEKTKNIKTMVRLRQEQYSRNYYDEALSELIKEDIYFEDYANDPRLDSLDPYSKKVVVDLMEYIRKDNADKDQNMTAMAQTVRETLARIEARKKELELNIINRENNLLGNDRNLNLKIRNLLNALERESSLTAREREAELNNRIAAITKTLQIIGLISIVLAIGFIILIFKDASRSQQYNKDLQKSNEVTQSLLKSREQLMATITHDMRSPLNTVIGFTDLLKKTPLEPKQQRYLETVEKSGDYILNLVNDLLDFSKLEAGKIKIENIPFNPEKLVNDVLVVSLPKPLKEGIEITTHIGEEVNQLFISDPFRIKQILSNLVTNAYKFTQSGSITITANYQSGELIFKVIDTGCGIPKEQQEHIFKEFAQAEKTTQRKFGGFGLGLSISRRLTTLLKGDLKLESTPHKGSTFTLIIPVKKSGQLEESPSKNQSPAATEKILIQHVLLVDDEPAQLQLARALFANYDLQVTTAFNGAEALELLNKNRPDLILTDIQMPVMDGISLIKELKKSKQLKTIPVIALSGNATLKKSDYRFFGFATHLEKPFKPADLIQTVETIGMLKTKASIAEGDHIESKKTHFSLNQLRAFTGNDQQALASILHIFTTSTAENLLALEQNKHDTDSIKEIAHKMLPMIRQLEAHTLIALLEKLEGLKPNEQPKSNLSEILAEVREQSQILLEEIGQYLKA